MAAAKRKLLRSEKEAECGITHEDLAGKFQFFVDVIQEWIDGDEPTREWPPGSGRVVKVMDSETESAFRGLVELVEPAQEFAADAFRLALAIDEVAEQFGTWMDQIEANPLRTDPMGSRALWTAWDHAVAAIVPLRFSPPEPIEELIRRDKVPPSQVAAMYGFRRDDGTLDVDAVFRELKEPGSVYKPDEWVHPSAIIEREREEEAWTERRRRKPLGTGRRDNTPAKVAPESIEELIGQKVSVEQIAIMKQISAEEVRAYAAKHGLKIVADQPAFFPANPAVAHEKRMEAEADRIAAYEAGQAE